MKAVQRWTSVGVLALGLLGTACAGDKPLTVKLCHEDVNAFPWVLENRPGLNIVHLKAVEQKLAIKFEISPMPWKRCQEEMREGTVDGIFSASFKPERQAIGHYPMLGDKIDPTRAMMFDGYSLYRVKGGSAQWDGKKLSVSGPIGAQPGYSIIDQLRQLGARVDDGSKTADDNFKKLLAGRLDAVAVQTLEGDNALASNPEFSSRLEKLTPPLVDKPFFLMLSKQFVSQYGELAKDIWKTVAEVRESADYRGKMAVFR